MGIRETLITSKCRQNDQKLLQLKPNGIHSSLTIWA